MNIQNEEEKSQDQSSPLPKARGTRLYFIALASVVVFALLVILFLQFRQPRGSVTEEEGDHKDHETASNAVVLDPSAVQQNLVLQQVQMVPVTEALIVTGNIEPNQLALQQITPLTAGRVEHVSVNLGDFVRRGQLLVTISSPSVAELHGKLHEAETRLQVARQNLNRVQKTENRVAILKAKADLEQAEATLNRIATLEKEGLAPQKDLEAARTELSRARAEYEFQKNIPLNREIGQARAEVQIATAEIMHITNSLRAQGAHVEEAGSANAKHDISIVDLRAPMSGAVIERFVNPGAGIEAGKALLTIADTSRVWVIANVPENQIGSLKVGMVATVIPQGNQNARIFGRINYIDPRVSEETRTASVRVEVLNEGGLLKVGGFARVEFANMLGSNAVVAVPGESIQRIEGKSVVFVAKPGKPNEFESRAVTTSKELQSGLVAISSGLQAGETVVAKGSFILKSSLLKEQIGDEH